MTYPELLSLKAVLGKLLKLRGNLLPTAPQTAQEGLGKANEEKDGETAYGQKQPKEQAKKPHVTQPGVDAANIYNPNAPGGPNEPRTD